MKIKRPNMDLIKNYTREVEIIENKFESLAEDKNSRDKLKEEAHEILAKLKKDQDNMDYFDLNDDFEDLIFRLITIIGQL